MQLGHYDVLIFNIKLYGINYQNHIYLIFVLLINDDNIIVRYILFTSLLHSREELAIHHKLLLNLDHRTPSLFPSVLCCAPAMSNLEN